MNFKNHISQIPGWRTSRKIIVIESDDWGSIRMKSAETIKHLSKRGINIKDPYNLNDSLASEKDLTSLFEVLSSVKDIHNNPVILTANTIVANPDFKKIKESNYKEYYYELFTDSLKNYPKHNNSFSLWKEGMHHKLFHPQFHGREHVNTSLWLKQLKLKNSKAKISFENEIFGLRESNNNDIRNSYMRALDFFNEEELKLKENIIVEGLEIFNEIFGYKSKSFIAPSYVWSSSIEKKLANYHVKYLQGIQYQYIPKIDKKRYKRKIHYIGQKNKLNQIYLVRNAFFEPSLITKNDVIDDTLRRIEIAFKWKKPAIIGSHRLNYIGFINPSNRDKNLKLLESLLKSIVKKWPTVEFMTSDQLGDLITST